MSGALCALLLVAGRWPVKLGAALVAVWFLYAQAEFGSGSSWPSRWRRPLTTRPSIALHW